MEIVVGETRKSIPRLLLTVICALVLSGILVVGLWPFHPPKNDVHWLRAGNGLFFGRHGSAVTAGEFRPRASQTTTACSLEIWLEPKSGQSSGTVLAFYRPDSRLVPLSLRQSLGDLKLELGGRDPSAQKKKLYVDDVFKAGEPVFLTISSADTGTAIYVDGRLLTNASTFRISGRDLTGFLVVGNAPATTDSWSGKVKGIAFYERELTARVVAQHFSDWVMFPKPQMRDSNGVIALYRFDDNKRNVVENEVDSATDLVIPERFFVLRKPFLERPWNEFRFDKAYWEDVAINIAGFMPLGFCFAACFSTIGNTKSAIWLTIGLGLAVSLLIEVLQAFLPTRDSGMTDLITNTVGTAVGAILLKWSINRGYLCVASVVDL